jgi:predicted AlkP superfamily pyrophosphatase or phosphodiesterase
MKTITNRVRSRFIESQIFLLCRKRDSRRYWGAGLSFALTCVLLSMTAFGQIGPSAKAEHVVVVVWDGMRPDFITPEHTPTLYQLARQGTFFTNHHPVYISTTEVNGTALSTGAYPQHSGIIANAEYRPQIDDLEPVAMEDKKTVRVGDAVSGGHYIAVPTLPEIVQHAGFRTAVMGTKSVALLLDRAKERTSEPSKESVDFFKGDVLPPAVMAQLVAANEGEPFPVRITYPNIAQDRWTTRALTHGLWKDDVPKFSVLWMSDPDYTQHDTGPGSPAALAALESVDKNLAVVLATLNEKKIRDKTDVFVVSDHGFSTVSRNVNVAGKLAEAGFRAGKKLRKTANGDVLVVPLGGSVSFYVIGHDEVTIRKLLSFLQASDFAGVIFSRIALEGTFPLEQVRVNSDNAPDLLISMKWSMDKNEFGTPGLFVGDTKKKGSHGSLSPFDMHNTLVTAGPDFRAGFNDELPTGNTDLAPTILWILGITPAHPTDGRILSEAIVGMKAPTISSQTKIEASRDGETFHWHQYLRFSAAGDVVYFDEGNGESIPK